MIINLRGVRGSIPVPGPATVKYGGNTTCISIRTEEGDWIILDGGTGIRELGLVQIEHLPLKSFIFLTHTHWDHIQGLPFYAPLFIPGNEIHFYGAFDPVYQKDLQTILSQQMEYCYFPVRESELKADLHYHKVREYEKIQVGSATVTPILLNHPVLNYGYKVEEKGQSFFFTGDYEPAANIYNPDEEEYEQYQEMVDEQNKSVIEFIREVDVAVCDAQYTVSEYASKQGWGHGTYDSCLSLATKAEIKSLYFTHHDPTRTDEQLDIIFSDLLKRSDLPSDIELGIASEGLEIKL